MATQIVYLTGICNWAKLLEPDKKYKYWGLDLYPDAQSLDKLKKSGAQLELRTDKEGKGPFVKLRRVQQKLIKSELVKNDPPNLLDHDNKPLPQETLIGNGSKVTCKIEVFDTVKGKGCNLVTVRVDELVEYSKVEVDTDVNLPF